jgi:uncharacterized protein YecE (DUF72 family)
MDNNKPGIEFGTCSWNYDSWIGLVYSKKAPYSAAYLTEYVLKYPTVEIDSWFYKTPDLDDVTEYASRVLSDFSFACKLTESISLTHERTRDKTAPLVANPSFLSVEKFLEYTNAVQGISKNIFMLELEFEYLNKQKMPNVTEFMKCLERFVTSIDRSIPLGIETRNGNYLTKEYFRFLKDHDIAHVFSEKIYMPHIYEVYEKYGDFIGERVAIRLLGGDRKKIEEKTKGNWNEIVDPKGDLPEIVSMLKSLSNGSRVVKVYLNNHYEGSAPKSIERIKELIG